MKSNASSYLPLIVVVSISLAMAIASTMRAGFVLSGIETSFMGYFFCLLSMFKLFNLTGFIDGFAMYDVITKRFRAYGYMYPFVELGLGLSYLCNCCPVVTNAVAIVVMTISGIGVIKSVSAGMNLRCACLGTVLNVPLSTVSIVENLGMGVMAVISLVLVLY